VTLGSVLDGEVCDIAVPLKPHSNTTDMRATVEGATRLDDTLITRSPFHYLLSARFEQYHQTSMGFQARK
jgi:hypothetical protein